MRIKAMRDQQYNTANNFTISSFTSKFIRQIDNISETNNEFTQVSITTEYWEDQSNDTLLPQNFTSNNTVSISSFIFLRYNQSCNVH